MRSNAETQAAGRLAAPPRLLVAASVVAPLVLLGCGTDVKWLLERDSVLVARADKVAARAEAIEPDLTTQMYDAEDAKRAACETIYTSISEEMTQPPSYGEELASGIGAFLAYLFPFEEVERCADAQAKYEAAVKALERQVGSADGAPNATNSGKD